jgi:hypothetical protein
MIQRSPTVFFQPGLAFLFIALQPLVACLAADLVTPVERIRVMDGGR